MYIIDWLSDWFQQYVNKSRIILCPEIRKLRSLNVQIVMFCVIVF